MPLPTGPSRGSHLIVVARFERTVSGHGATGDHGEAPERIADDAAAAEVDPTPTTLLASALCNFHRFEYEAMLRDVVAAEAAVRDDNSPAAIGVDILMPEVDALSPERVLGRLAIADPTLAVLLRNLPSNDRALADALHRPARAANLE